jgi:type I restriction enzyme S subunit
MSQTPSSQIHPWQDAQLRLLALDFISGGTPNTKEPKYWNGLIPWITGADIEDFRVAPPRRRISSDAVKNSATNIVPKDSLLVVTRTGVGKMAVAEFDVAISQDLTGIPLKPGFSPHFALLALRHQSSRLIAFQQGATIKGVVREDLEQLQIACFPPSEQKRVLEILGQADDLRKKRIEADALAERLIPALFHKNFGDPIGNPRGWPVVPFDKAAEDISGGEAKLQRRDYQPRGKHSVIDQGQSPIAGYTDDDALLFSGKLPVILFGDHTRAFKFVDFPFVLGADGVKVLEPQAGWNPRFLFHLLRLMPIPSAGYARHFKYLKERSLIHPPLPLQERFAEQAAEITMLASRQAASRKTLDKLFQVLLHRAFTGELTAKWREAHMAELLREMELQAKALNLPTPAN